jgi:DNA-binding response OmpR family regulator
MPRILIVDDDHSFRKMLWLVLVKWGYDAVEAANGKEAEKLHRFLPADLLLTDLIMPEQEGLETIQQFRRLHPAVKIIAMSGGGRSDPRDFLKTAKLFGADRTFAKPFALEELAAAIAQLLSIPSVEAAR